MDYDEVYEDTWEGNENECLTYLKNDVLSAAFSNARYSKCMEKINGFGMKNSLTLATKFFISLRDDNGELSILIPMNKCDILYDNL